MGLVEDYVTEVSVDDVRGTLFDYHHMHQEVAEYTPQEVELQTRAVEDILDLGTPEFYETVEIDHDPWIVMVIDGATHLVHVRDDRTVEALSVGSLDGGVYSEVTESDGTERPLLGTFTHPRLPGPIRISIARRRDRRFYEDIRIACRKWASRPVAS